MKMCFYITTQWYPNYVYQRLYPTGRWKLSYSPNIGEHIKEDESPMLSVEHRGADGLRWVKETDLIYSYEEFEYINDCYEK